MGWASGFRAGSDVMRQAIDTYQQAELRRGIDAAQNLKPEEIRAPGATQSQVDAANAETSALAAQDAQEFGLQVPQQYRQAEVGQATAPSKYRLGNQVLDTAPSEQQVAMARRRGMVDAVTRFDPTRGMELGLRLDQADREKTNFENQQTDRKTAKELEQSRRDYFKSLNEIKDPNQLADMLGGAFSKDGSGVDAMLTFDPKANKFLFASRVPGMPSRQLDRSELVNMAMGIWEQGNGDFNRGMQIVMDGIREKRRMGEADRADAAGLAKGNAELFWKGNQFGLDQQRYGLDREYKMGLLGLQREALNLRASQGRGGTGGSPEFENQINGVLEGYQAAMAAGPAGRQAAAIYAQEYDQLRGVAAQKGLKVPPVLSALVNAQKGQGAAKLEQLVPEGEMRRQGNQLLISDGLGNWVPADARGRPLGVMPSERDATLVKAGVPQAMLGQLQWANDGTGVMFDGQEYAPNEIPQLVKDIKQSGVRAIRDRETNKFLKSDRGYAGLQPANSWYQAGPDITFRNPDNMPSIYNTDPEAWARYRASQNR